MNTRRTTLIVAIVLAIGTGWLTLNYLSGLQRQANGNGAPRQIVVASQDIPARVPITASMLATVSRPASSVDPDAIGDPAKAVGQLSLISIPAGSTITESKVGHPTDVGLPVRLKPGMRAVSIQIDKVKGVSGLIEPGDFVDVIAVLPRMGNHPPPAASILRGIRVLSVGDSLEYSSATPSPQEANSTTVTLEVTPKQADLISMADLNTVLRLALRSPREPLNSYPTEAMVWPEVQQPSNPAPAPAPVAVPAVAQSTPGPKADPPHRFSSVVVIDGDKMMDGSQ
ncbi:MAG TPA: Flp pilus assembly protein CpaB [Candidatus Baltobacteraceae bacterium]|nr:Flp pilus assembly protein CpaB [Candidatus Baltobacteraceae bacterium]